MRQNLSESPNGARQIRATARIREGAQRGLSRPFRAQAAFLAIVDPGLRRTSALGFSISPPPWGERPRDCQPLFGDLRSERSDLLLTHLDHQSADAPQPASQKLPHMTLP